MFDKFIHGNLMKFNKSRSGHLYLFTLLILIFFAIPSASFGSESFAAFKGEIGSLEKGTRFLGLNVSLKAEETENPGTVYQDINSWERDIYNISAYGGYFLEDYWALGGQVNYIYSESDSGFFWDDRDTRIQTINKFTSMGVMMRNYLPIDTPGRFFLFVQSNVDFGYGKNIAQTTLPDEINRKVSEFYIVDMGVTPGLMAFVDKGVAIEVSVDVMGLTAEWGDYDYNNGEREGNSSSVDLDFTLKLFSLFIGITYYF